MIDFSTLKGLTIPEGVITQIADARGKVLWSAVDNLTVTMTQANPSDVTASISWDGGSASTPGTYQVPEGTKVSAYIRHWKKITDVHAQILLNGVLVATGENVGSYSDTDTAAEYSFTLTKDITFYVGTYGKGAYTIYINEV